MPRSSAGTTISMATTGRRTSSSSSTIRSDPDRDAPGSGRAQAAADPALCRCLDHRLVQLYLWRQQAGERAHQAAQSDRTLIETRRDLVERKPQLIQRFVDASIIGWYNYIYGDNRPANELIKQHNQIGP